METNCKHSIYTLLATVPVVRSLFQRRIFTGIVGNVLCMSSGTCTHFQISTPFMCHCLYTVLGTVRIN